MEERWLPVVGFEGHYEVSDNGRVRSLGKMGRESLLLKQTQREEGHLQVSLCKHGIRTEHKVHRLVLIAFGGPAPDGHMCAHDNGIASDNRFSNLLWKTPLGNAADTIRHGRTNRGEKAPNSKLVASDIGRVFDLYRSGARVGAIARWFGMSHQQISKILRKQRWAHI